LLSATDFELVIDRMLAQTEGRIPLEVVRSLLESAGLGDDATGGTASVH